MCAPSCMPQHSNRNGTEFCTLVAMYSIPHRWKKCIETSFKYQSRSHCNECIAFVDIAANHRQMQCQLRLQIVKKTLMLRPRSLPHTFFKTLTFCLDQEFQNFKEFKMLRIWIALILISFIFQMLYLYKSIQISFILNFLFG